MFISTVLARDEIKRYGNGIISKNRETREQTKILEELKKIYIEGQIKHIHPNISESYGRNGQMYNPPPKCGAYLQQFSNVCYIVTDSSIMKNSKHHGFSIPI